MADEDKIEEKAPIKKVSQQTKKKKLPTKKYELISEVTIRGVKHFPPEKVDLTEEGRRYFISKNYIKK